jgi:hypothetical protein
MLCNVAVSGGRWRCASCETFLSYQELQLCSLTEAALKKFGTQVSSQRDRVEFRADKTFHLLPTQRLRYGNKKRPTDTAGSDRRPIKNDVVDEIILLDDD